MNNKPTKLTCKCFFLSDFDGWTPLHAASHWAQKEACEILCENYCNMEIKNHVGQTAFDVADPDLIPQLQELKKKQANMQKDRPDITSLINRPAVPSITNTTSKPSNRRWVIIYLLYNKISKRFMNNIIFISNQGHFKLNSC